MALQQASPCSPFLPGTLPQWGGDDVCAGKWGRLVGSGKCDDFGNLVTRSTRRERNGIEKKSRRCLHQSWVTLAGKSRYDEVSDVTENHMQFARIIPHICHGRHGRRPCKFFLAGVNFYKFNAKRYHPIYATPIQNLSISRLSDPIRSPDYTKYWMFLANFLHEIALYSLGRNKKRFITPSFIL